MFIFFLIFHHVRLSNAMYGFFFTKVSTMYGYLVMYVYFFSSVSTVYGYSGTLYTLIIVHARLFFQIQFFGSARPYSGLHVYFSGQENRVYTIIQVCTIINFSYLSLHNYSGLPNNQISLLQLCISIQFCMYTIIIQKSSSEFKCSQHLL